MAEIVTDAYSDATEYTTTNTSFTTVASGTVTGVTGAGDSVLFEDVVLNADIKNGNLRNTTARVVIDVLDPTTGVVLDTWTVKPEAFSNDQDTYVSRGGMGFEGRYLNGPYDLQFREQLKTSDSTYKAFVKNFEVELRGRKFL